MPRLPLADREQSDYWRKVTLAFTAVALAIVANGVNVAALVTALRLMSSALSLDRSPEFEPLSTTAGTALSRSWKTFGLAAAARPL